MREFEIRQEVGLDAPRERVWRALTAEIGNWWSHRSGPDGSTVSLDPRLGGQFAEKWGNSEGAVWGVVTRVTVPERLRVVGHLGMQGPGRNDCTFELEARGNATLLKLTHYSYGHPDPMVEQLYRAGWASLLQRYLRAWVEEGKTYREVDAPEGDPAGESEPSGARAQSEAAAAYVADALHGIQALELPMEWIL